MEMNKVLLTLLASFIIVFSSEAQTEVKPSDLDGEWKMVFDFSKEDWEEEYEDESLLERIIASSVSGLVFNILEDLDIWFEFKDHNKLKITIEIFDERDVDYTRWYINKTGELEIGDHDFDGDEVWLFRGDKLVAYERNKGRLEEKNIYLERVSQ